jgi:hypothetical protein
LALNAGGPKRDAELRDALVLAGVGEPTLTELMALPGLTVALIKDVAGRARQGGKGAGAVVQDLRLAAERQELGERQRQRQATAREEAQRRTAAQKAADRQQEEAAGDWIDGLNDEDVETLYGKLLAEHPKAVPHVFLGASTKVEDVRQAFALPLFRHYGDGPQGELAAPGARRGGM